MTEEKLLFSGQRDPLPEAGVVEIEEDHLPGEEEEDPILVQDLDLPLVLDPDLPHTEGEEEGVQEDVLIQDLVLL